MPVLEAPDETSHVAMVRYIAQNRDLPVQRPPDFPAGQEGSQPPLYYALGALLWQLAPQSTVAPTFAAHNPFVRFNRDPTPLDNRNLYAHTAAEAFPYQGDVLAIHLVRLLSALFGTITVLATYLLAHELFPNRRILPLAAAGLVALNPEFVFISAVVNNDVATAATATITLWLAVRWRRRGGSLGAALVLGASLGAALLAKTSGLLLAPVVGLALVGDVLGLVSWRRWVGRVSVVCLVAAGCAGWWFVRNVILYGDPLGWDVMLQANSPMIRGHQIDPAAAIQVLWRARDTYWGAFGWTNVFFQPSVYRTIEILEGVALLGLGAAGLRALLARRPGGPTDFRRWLLGGAWLPFLLVAGWPLLVFVSLVRWVQINNAADQWRLLFPAVGAIGVLLAFGLAGPNPLAPLPAREGGTKVVEGSPFPRRQGGEGVRSGPLLEPAIAFVLSAAVLLTNATVLRSVIRPAYIPPSLPSVTNERQTLLSFGSVGQLVGYQFTPGALSPGSSVQVNLTWRAEQLTTTNYAAAVWFLDSAGRTIAQAHSWPGGGRAPTSGWRSGQLVRDQYVLAPVWQSSDPQLATVWLSLYDPSVAAGPALPITAANGEAIGNGIPLGTIKLAPTTPTESGPSQSSGAHFGSAITLAGFDLAQSPAALDVILVWRPTGPVDRSYHVFVHVVDRTGKLVAQHDSPPRGGAYPTDAWSAGETIHDEHEVSLAGVPPGTYGLQVGLYDPSSGARLPITSVSGQSVADDSLTITTIER